MLRPLLIASLLSDDRGLADRPALLVTPDDRSARDMAADLRAYLAPRRVRYYPSRGTGYASQISPPPHLVGLRIDALDALTAESDPVVVASAIALAEAVPEPPCARPASPLAAARRSTSERSPSDSSRRLRADRPGRRSGDSSPSAAASSTSFRRPRSGRCGSSCSATRSTRCAGSRPSHSARWARPSGSSWRPPPSSTPSTGGWPGSRSPKSAREGEEPPSLADALPLEHFRRSARPGARGRA